MKRRQVWFLVGTLMVLLAGGCSNDDSSTSASNDTFPFGLETAALTDDFNQDGVNEQITNGRFSYDGQGRVIGYEATYQSDYDSDGMVDDGMKMTYTFDPTIPLDDEIFGDGGPFFGPKMLAAAAPAGAVVTAKSRSFFDDDLLYMIAVLGKSAPVKMVVEFYGSGVGFEAAGLPDHLMLTHRMTVTFAYDASGRMVQIVSREEDSIDARQYTMSRALNDAGDPTEESDLEEYFAPGASVPNEAYLYRTVYSYDAAGNLTKRVEIGDDYNDGFYEYQGIINFTNSYNDAGQLVQVVQTRPGSTWRATTLYGYDAAGNRISDLYETQDVEDGPVVDRNRHDYTYDAAGNKLTSTFLAENGLADGTYDYTWEYTWTYDSAGKMLSEEYYVDYSNDDIWDDGDGTRWSFDATGRPTEVQELSGVPLALTEKRTYRYDAAGRVDEASTYRPDSGTDTTLFAFAADGRILSIVETFTPEVMPAIPLPSGSSSETTFTYDDAGQVSGYLFTDDQDGDGIAEYKDEAVVTVNEPTVTALVKSYYYDSGTLTYILDAEQALDLGFLRALPKGEMVLPNFFEDNVSLTLPKVPGFLLYGRDLLQGPVR